MEFHLIPKYRAISVVEALKIKEVRHSLQSGEKVTMLTFEDERFNPVHLYHNVNAIEAFPDFQPGEYWVRFEDGKQGSYPAQMIENSYVPATVLTPEMLKNIRAVVAKDFVSDEEVSNLNQMVLTELHDENQGVLGGPDVIHMQWPGRLAEAVTELVINKLRAMSEGAHV